MTAFLSAGLLLAWVTIAMLALGFARLTRQIASLRANTTDRPEASLWPRQLSSQALQDAAGDEAVLAFFYSSSCPRCHSFIDAIQQNEELRNKTVLITGDKRPGKTSIPTVCDAPWLFEQAGVSGTPAWGVLDSRQQLLSLRTPAAQTLPGVAMAHAEMELESLPIEQSEEVNG